MFSFTNYDFIEEHYQGWLKSSELNYDELS